MAHDVFISYSTEDKLAADAVCSILENSGVRCWMAPRDIMPGSDWGGSIVNGIRTSRVLLLIFSSNANQSKQIKREVEVAADGGVTIVPLRIENILPSDSFKYFLGNIHWIDALPPPLAKHLHEVAAKVKAILCVDPVPAPTPKPPIVPSRRIFPVIGGIIVVLIAAFLGLYLWQFRKTAPPVVIASTPRSESTVSLSTPPGLPVANPTPIASPISASTPLVLQTPTESPTISPPFRRKGRWLFPDSSSRYLTRAELSKLGPDDLWRARNEIYARGGLIFSTPQGRDFAAWLGEDYRPRSSDQDWIFDRMNPYEQANVQLIREFERNIPPKR
jgi:hypothetical protein